MDFSSGYSSVREGPDLTWSKFEKIRVISFNQTKWVS